MPPFPPVSGSVTDGIVGAVQVGTIEAPSVTTSMAVVFAIIGLAVVFFILQPIPLDVTALLVIVVLVLLGQWTTISPVDGISGFASEATITVLMMFILSEGIRRVGAVQLLVELLIAISGRNHRRQLGSLVGLSGLAAGFVNNTPVVALMIPVVGELADRTGVSPSRLLIPLSFAAMLGGTLTLIGTSTNLLASAIISHPEYLGRPFSMFEFTPLGALVLVAGASYLVIASPHLIPERIPAHEEQHALPEFEMELAVPADSPIIGRRIREILDWIGGEQEVTSLLVRGRRRIVPSPDRRIASDDVLVVRGDVDTVLAAAETTGLEPVLAENAPDEQRVVAEVIVAPDGDHVGSRIFDVPFVRTDDVDVLAMRRGSMSATRRLEDRPLRGGDTLLVLASRDALTRLGRDRNVIVAYEYTRPTYRREKLPVAVGIMIGVVGLAAFDLVPILISSIAGAVAMVATGVLASEEIYDAVDWSVIVLLAGLIPLGMAMEATGAATFLATHAVVLTAGLGVGLVLALTYLFTALLTELLTNNASVVLMIPVAFDVAVLLGADPYAFLLAVVFACSTPFLSPVGYQTNLMVYGPGGYAFTDFARVGIGLQLLLTVVTTGGIMLIWGV